MNMQRITFLLLLCLAGLTATAQKEWTPPTAEDTARGIKIVDRYANYVNYERICHDSILFIVTHIIDYEHPEDTMTIYRWYHWPNQERFEMWQKGQMEMGAYSDGRKIFKKFSTKYRAWRHALNSTYYDFVEPYDIRGPLGKWRSRGAEMYYAGEYTFEGQKVDRVYVSMVGALDRLYYFERATGLLFLVTELKNQMGGGVPDIDNMVDWRGWHEFVPVGDCMMPSEESYQANGQLVILHHSYRLIPYDEKCFTEDYFHK
ncbi:MAG: hypothetical protein J6X88_03030 [Bacteroidales bacterium]|nr:hypothetical protein [Bacteroidales bacterium]MBP5644388.1 hypothetical protein [Bacteroidales bacterium]